MKGVVNFDESETIKNLARAFAGEVQDGARYQFLAQMALDEGYQYLQLMVKTLAKNEMSHAKTLYQLITNNCTKSIKNIEICAGYPFKSGTLLEEIKNNIENENSEATSVYLAFAKVAEDEGFEAVAKTFRQIASVEECHTKLLQQVYDKMKSNKLYRCAKDKKWKCSDCGFEHTSKQSWSICPLCSKPQGYVEISIDTDE